MFRFFPTISEENSAISEAMRMRQVAGKKRNVFKKLEYELVPVMMSTIRIADELSQASMTKGLGGDIKRTHICEVGLRFRDYLLLISLTAAAVLFITEQEKALLYAHSAVLTKRQRAALNLTVKPFLLQKCLIIAI